MDFTYKTNILMKKFELVKKTKRDASEMNQAGETIEGNGEENQQKSAGDAIQGTKGPEKVEEEEREKPTAANKNGGNSADSSATAVALPSTAAKEKVGKEDWGNMNELEIDFSMNPFTNAKLNKGGLANINSNLKKSRSADELLLSPTSTYPVNSSSSSHSATKKESASKSDGKSDGPPPSNQSVGWAAALDMAVPASQPSSAGSKSNIKLKLQKRKSTGTLKNNPQEIEKLAIVDPANKSGFSAAPPNSKVNEVNESTTLNAKVTDTAVIPPPVADVSQVVGIAPAASAPANTARVSAFTSLKKFSKGKTESPSSASVNVPAQSNQNTSQKPMESTTDIKIRKAKDGLQSKQPLPQAALPNPVSSRPINPINGKERETEKQQQVQRQKEKPKRRFVTYTARHARVNQKDFKVGIPSSVKELAITFLASTRSQVRTNAFKNLGVNPLFSKSLSLSHNDPSKVLPSSSVPQPATAFSQHEVGVMTSPHSTGTTLHSSSLASFSGVPSAKYDGYNGTGVPTYHSQGDAPSSMYGHQFQQQQQQYQYPNYYGGSVEYHHPSQQQPQMYLGDYSGLEGGSSHPNLPEASHISPTGIYPVAMPLVNQYSYLQPMGPPVSIPQTQGSYMGLMTSSLHHPSQQYIPSPPLPSARPNHGNPVTTPVLLSGSASSPLRNNTYNPQQQHQPYYPSVPYQPSVSNVEPVSSGSRTGRPLYSESAFTSSNSNYRSGRARSGEGRKESAGGNGREQRLAPGDERQQNHVRRKKAGEEGFQENPEEGRRNHHPSHSSSAWRAGSINREMDSSAVAPPSDPSSSPNAKIKFGLKKGGKPSF